MAVPTESSKRSKVLDVWSCCVLHNLYMRYRMREYLETDADYAFEQACFAALAREVIAEVDELHADDDRAGLQVEASCEPRMTFSPVFSELELRDAGIDLRDEVCRIMWSSAHG